MKTIIIDLIPRGVYTLEQTITFDANPAASLQGYIASGSGKYIFQSGNDEPIEVAVSAPQQFEFILQGGTYTLKLVPFEPSEFNAYYLNIIQE